MQQHAELAGSRAAEDRKDANVAQRMVVTRIDDLTGVEDETVEEVRFGLDGAEYEIDLSEDNADRLRRALQEYVDAARAVGGRRVSRTRGRRGGGDTPAAKEPARDPATIREWARTQPDLPPVSDKGRIPKVVAEAYEAAHARRR